MDIFDGVRVFLRWWFVAIPLFLLTVLVAFAGTSGFQPEYTTEASVLFVGPTVTVNDRAEFERVNPLLNQSSALVTATVVSSLSISGPEVAEILRSEGLSTDFDVGTEARSPILLLLVRADSREIATATAVRLAELVESDVQLRQEAVDVPAEFRVTTSIIGLSPVGEADYGSRAQVRIVLIAIGLVVSGAIVFGLDGFARRRARDRALAPESDDAEADGVVAAPHTRTDDVFGDADVSRRGGSDDAGSSERPQVSESVSTASRHGER